MNDNGRRPTNREYCVANEEFLQACAQTGTEPSSHQAAKFRHKRGRAYWLSHGLARLTADGQLQIAGRDYPIEPQHLNGHVLTTK